jgi:cytochrome c2
MPRTVARLADARDLGAYLSTLRDTLRVPRIGSAEAWAADSSLVATGRQLFDQYQCRGCHQLEGTGNRVGPGLNQVGTRRLPSYMFALLMDPQRVIPGTAMEDKHLWKEEARALTAFLSTRRAEASDLTPAEAP